MEKEKGKKKTENKDKRTKKGPTRLALMGRSTPRAGCAARGKRRPDRSIGFVISLPQ
jgi:hypothetical protein